MTFSVSANMMNVRFFYWLADSGVSVCSSAYQNVDYAYVPIAPTMPTRSSSSYFDDFVSGGE